MPFGLDRNRHGCVARDHNSGSGVTTLATLLDKLDTTHSGHQQIYQNTTIPALAMSGEKVSTIGKDFDPIFIRLKQIMHRVSNSAVVIHYIHSAPTIRPDSMRVRRAFLWAHRSYGVHN